MSSKNFILLALTFTSLIHFKFISVYDIKYKVGIQLYSFTYEYQVSPAIFVEPHSFIHWIVLHPWCKTISFQYIHKSLLLGSLLYFIGWCLFLCKYNAILSSSVSSVAQSCLTLCSPMDCSTRGLPAHHQLPELAWPHVHRVCDTIQPSHPLSSPSPPAFNLSQHQGLFQRVSSLHQVAKILELQLQHQSFQWIFRTDFL